MTPHAWKQPVGGKTVQWKFLTGGDVIDLDANYSAPHVAHLRTYAQYAMRIVSCEGVAGDFQVDNFRAWDEYDINEFAAEVDRKERERMVALSGKGESDAVARLDKTIVAVVDSVKRLSADVQILLQAAKAAERQHGPLKVPGSPS